MSIDDPTPQPVSRQDAAALIGILATLEGELLAGTDSELWRRLAHRVRNDGLMPPKVGGRAGVRIAVANLNQRLRYALGEYDEPPAFDDGLVQHHVRFDAADKAAAFVEAMKGVGLQTRQLQFAHPDSEPWLVMVSTGEPVLSPGFERRDEQIREAAQRTGGFYEGWGGGAPPQPSGTT